jgi:hypothetical protein
MIDSDCLHMHLREKIPANGCFKEGIEIELNWGDTTFSHFSLEKLKKCS